MRRFALAVLLTSALWACSGPEETPERASGAPGDSAQSPVWARVGGEPVTEYQVRRALTRMLGRQQALHATPEQRRRALEGLVRVRAMADQARSDLTEAEKRRIRTDVAAYRNRLLSRRYLAERDGEPKVSETELRRYYRKHPERFGAETRARYRMLVPGAGYSPSDRGALLKALGSADSVEDWKAWARGRREEGVPVRVQEGWRGDRDWAQPLARALEGLSIGETSRVVSIEGRPHLVRLVGKEKGDPRPYAEVRDEVRRAVRARALRDTVSQGAAKALEKARVDYTDKAPASEDSG